MLILFYVCVASTVGCDSTSQVFELCYLFYLFNSLFFNINNLRYVDAIIMTFSDKELRRLIDELTETSDRCPANGRFFALFCVITLVNVFLMLISVRSFRLLLSVHLLVCAVLFLRMSLLLHLQTVYKVYY